MKRSNKPLTLITRDDARAARLTRYYTGEPCRNGHISERMTISGECCGCRHQARVNKNQTLKSIRNQAVNSLPEGEKALALEMINKHDIINPAMIFNSRLLSYAIENREKIFKVFDLILDQALKGDPKSQKFVAERIWPANITSEPTKPAPTTNIQINNTSNSKPTVDNSNTLPTITYNVSQSRKPIDDD